MNTFFGGSQIPKSQLLDSQDKSRKRENNQKMSLYSGCSDKYWKERQTKKNVPTSRTVISLLSISLLFLGVIIVHNRQYKARNDAQQRQERLLLIKEKMEVRPIRTLDQEYKCELRMKELARSHCSQVICQEEARSIPRPTMYQACVHGCSTSFYASSIMGCQEKSEEDTFKNIGSQSYGNCLPYRDLDPKPDVFSTCRKYHREGIRFGRQLGYEFISDSINKEWDVIKKSYQTELDDET